MLFCWTSQDTRTAIRRRLQGVAALIKRASTQKQIIVATQSPLLLNEFAIRTISWSPKLDAERKARRSSVWTEKNPSFWQWFFGGYMSLQGRLAENCHAQMNLNRRKSVDRYALATRLRQGMQPKTNFAEKVLRVHFAGGVGGACR